MNQKFSADQEVGNAKKLENQLRKATDSEQKQSKGDNLCKDTRMGPLIRPLECYRSPSYVPESEHGLMTLHTYLIGF